MSIQYVQGGPEKKTTSESLNLFENPSIMLDFKFKCECKRSTSWNKYSVRDQIYNVIKYCDSSFAIGKIIFNINLKPEKNR